MNTTRIITILFLAAAPLLGAAVEPKLRPQNDGMITGEGEWHITSGNIETVWHMRLTFHPAGGPVTGTLIAKGEYPFKDIDAEGNVTIYPATTYRDMTLQGEFSGGDGGLVGGTLTGEWGNDVAATNYHHAEKVAGTWEGRLKADGAGDGVWGIGAAHGNNWKIQYPADDFIAGLGKPTPTVIERIATVENPTEEATPPESEPAETIEKPTEEVTPGGGKSLTHEVSLHPHVEEVFRSEPVLDAAMLEVLHQDGAIIACDREGSFYAITNRGQKIALPPELQEILEQSYGFSVLQNADLLQASPGVRKFAEREGQSALGQINGGSGTEYFAMPKILKSYDYMKVNTGCSGGACSPEVTMAALKISWKIKLSGILYRRAVGSSEHGSIRGTINGGGDFIYEPPGGRGKRAALMPVGWGQAAAGAAYLGVQADAFSAASRGAVVRQVQKGSPAAVAGLLPEDVIQRVAGEDVTAANPLEAVLVKHKPGEEVEIGVLRAGKTASLKAALVELTDPVLKTPAAEITGGSDVELLLDIGLNGVTAVLPLHGTVKVRELVTGDEVAVPEGRLVIVVPGEAIGEPQKVGEGQINRWWEAPAVAPTPAPKATDLPGWVWLGGIGVCGLGVLVVIILLVVLLVRKKKG